LKVTDPAPEEIVVPAVFTKVATKGAAVVKAFAVLLKAIRALLFIPTPPEKEIKSVLNVLLAETNGTPAKVESDEPTVTSLL